MKAYSSCVGEGPFTCEWFGEEAEKLREAGFAVVDETVRSMWNPEEADFAAIPAMVEALLK